MSRSHERDCFYKYMPCDTAVAVLNGCSLRWREPKQFNDPFDHQMSFNFPYTQDQFASAVIGEIEQIVYSDREPIFVERTGLATMALMLRANKSVIPKEEVLRTLVDGVEESKVGFQRYQDNLNSLITYDLNCSRVLCVTEKSDNVVMWSHYAASHTGVCVKLRCIDEVGNALLAAKPVRYESSFPLFPTLHEHVKHLTGEAPINFSKLLYQVPYIKHQHWSYEEEWRVHVPHVEPGNEAGFNDWSEAPEVFGAIYFGCRISPENASSLLGLVKAEYPHMEVYRASPSKKAFQIEFERIW